MNNSPLSPGVIRSIVDGAHPPSLWLQVIYIKPIDKESNGGTSRFKVAVSDGKNFIQAMVVAPLSQLFDQKVIEQFNIFRITNYQLNNLKGHTFLVLGNGSGDDVMKTVSKIGEPVNIENETSTPAAPAPAPGPAPAPPQSTSFTSNVPSYAQASMSLSNTATSAMAQNRPPSMPTPSFQSNVSKTPNPYGGGGGFMSGGGMTSESRTPAPAAMPMTSDYPEPESVQSIATLSPYHNKWVIKCRIVNKTDVKKFANAKGEGKLFSATCIDNTGEIRMTAFGDTVDRFFDLVQEGQVYFISNAQVKIAKRQFGVKNDYEIHLDNSSMISLARTAPGEAAIPSARYSFVPISQIADMEKDGTCDIIGVVKEVGDLANILTRTTQKNLSKRDITLMDSSGCSIRLTLWGAQAENYHDDGTNPILAVKGCRISDYNGRTLSTVGGNSLAINPDIREAHELRGWYDSNGSFTAAKNLSTSAAVAGAGQGGQKDNRKVVEQIKSEFLGSGEKPDYFTLLATITYIKSDSSVSYMACPTDGCNKKVHEEGPNMYRCEKCQKIYDRCDHRYVLSLQVSDHTGQTWLNAFNETGNQILGKTAEDLYYLRQQGDAAVTDVIKEATFKPYLFRIRAKMENYQGESKLRCNIMAALPINPQEESSMLIQKLDQIYPA